MYQKELGFLRDNFDYIQELIANIKKQKDIDIKKISDLERFVAMQQCVVKTITEIEEMKRYEN